MLPSRLARPPRAALYPAGLPRRVPAPTARRAAEAVSTPSLNPKGQGRACVFSTSVAQAAAVHAGSPAERRGLREQARPARGRGGLRVRPATASAARDGNTLAAVEALREEVALLRLQMREGHAAQRARFSRQRHGMAAASYRATL